MGLEPRVWSQLARADLELQLHRSTTTIASDATLAYVCRTLGKGPDEREHSCPCGSHAARTTPIEIDEVGAPVVGASAGQPKPPVLLTPRLDVRQEVKLGFLRDPGRLPERCNELARAGDELRGVPNSLPSIVTVPACCHPPTLQQASIGSSPRRRHRLAQS